MGASQRGVTLIELVIGIVVFSIALVSIGSFIAPQARRSVDPIMQIRAAELGQSLMTEILARRYDETRDPTGDDSLVTDSTRCNEDLDLDGDFDEPNEAPCSVTLGPDGETRANFDDVDDYNGLDETGATISNSLGNALIVGGVNLYEGFRVEVDVVYDGARFSLDNQDAKRITVTVTTPGGEVIPFSAYRSNF